MYGYQLRTEFDRATGSTWPLNVGQVYSTLSRLERDGLVEGQGDDGEGRTRYAITAAGSAELRGWFDRPVEHANRPRDELAIKLALAVTVPGIDVTQVVQSQRKSTLRRLQELTRLKAEQRGTTAKLPPSCPGRWCSSRCGSPPMPSCAGSTTARPACCEPPETGSRRLGAPPPRQPPPRGRSDERARARADRRRAHPRVRRRGGARAARSHPEHCGGRAGGGDGSVRVGQVDTAQPRRRSRRSDRRKHPRLLGSSSGACRAASSRPFAAGGWAMSSRTST